MLKSILRRFGGQTQAADGARQSQDDNPFKLERDIPDKLWQLIEQAGKDPDMLHRILSGKSRQFFLETFKAYYEARVEFFYQLDYTDRRGDASDDTAIDLSDAVIAMGKSSYSGMFYGTMNLPDRESWATVCRC